MKVVNGIKNFWKWRKVIYNDGWWDSYYIFEMLRFKFEDMEQKFRKYGISVTAKKDADKMKICKLLLDRLVKDEYYENVFKYHHKKWGEPELKWIDMEDSEYSSLEINHKNVVTEEDKKIERKEYKNLMHREVALRKQDINYLFKILSKNILQWWD